MKRLLRAVPVVVVLLLQASPAGAHARYEDSSPSNGETVSSPPSQVQADFSEPVTGDSYLEVTDPCGETVSGSSQPVADKISVSMSGSRAGTYTVYYKVQSTVDSHVTDGTFSFTSSGGDPCPGQEPPGGGGGNDNDPNEPGGGGSDDPGTGGDDTSADPSDTSGDVPTGGDPGDDNTSTGDAGGNGKRNEENAGNNNKNGSGSNRDDVDLALQNDERERQGPDPWDLPRDGLIAGLVIAALIGAAGGRIYASIQGPRD